MASIKFMRLPENTDLPLPGYATPGAAGMDLMACLPDGALTLDPGATALISTGFAVELPSNTEMQIRPRSGLAVKHGLTIPNSPGTVDEDYRGPVKVALRNTGTAAYTVRHGDRIAQAVVAPVLRLPAVEVDSLSESTRGSGGFGSTGVSR